MVRGVVSAGFVRLWFAIDAVALYKERELLTWTAALLLCGTLFCRVTGNLHFISPSAKDFKNLVCSSKLAKEGIVVHIKKANERNHVGCLLHRSNWWREKKKK